MMRRAALAAVTALVLLGCAASAQASSIVFVRGGDVWLTTPDGAREHRVTNGGAFTSVTQADDGTIFASADGILFRFAPDGRRLAGPTGTGHTLDLDVSPDGSKLTFWYLTSGGGRYTVIDSNGSPAREWGDHTGTHSTWITNDLTLQSNGAGYLKTTHAGPGGWTYWTGAPDGRKHASAITRAGDRLVAVVRGYDDAGPWTVAHYANASQPPRESEFPLQPPPAGQQPVVRCVQDLGTTEPRHPSFSPDGASIAWQLPDGVHVQPVFDLASCSQPAGGFTIAGATSPDWGPAEVPAAAAPVKRCVVPKLKGRTLKAAKRALNGARCRLGKVRRARSPRRSGTVIRQSVRAGKRLPAGAKVGVVLAKRGRGR